METNKQYFTKEQVESGEMQEFIALLLKQCYGADDNGYNDIHIRPTDCGSFVVEWAQLFWDNSYGGKFQFVDEDEFVMLEKIFPDNHTELCYDEDDYNKRLEEFLKENPGWVKTSYGTWTNEIENLYYSEKFSESLELNKEAAKQVIDELATPANPNDNLKDLLK